MFISPILRVCRLLSLCCLAAVSLNTFAADTDTKNEAELAIKKFKLADGFKAELFAAEPMLQNPVAFTLDEKGRAYVAETFRISDQVVDIRLHMGWLDEELSHLTIEDHLEKIKRHAAELPNMNAEAERINFIEDTEGDGKADKFSVFAESFTNTLDGIAAGVLARKGDIYFTCIPSLYLLRDTDGDGKADVNKVLQTGYGVRFGFVGHDLHGLVIGPDGNLYFSIGDRGLNVKQGDRNIEFTEGGAVLRCHLDGSGLEVFSYGLRNPQELAFDKYGNLFTGDNNSDAGDQARWVYLVEGGDSGWRIGYQFLNEPHARGPWNAEKMWVPEKAPGVGYIVPPIANIASGPAGLTYYPGVGLPEKYNDHFFLGDFRGSASQSVIHSFAVQPKGAGFEMIDRGELISKILVTDVDFGPDCCIYISDWVEGWGKTGKGRLYRLINSETSKTPLATETQKLLGDGMEKRSVDELAKLLAHQDRRVRLEAQFALAAKGETAAPALAEVAEKDKNQLARIHAIWGIGQIYSKAKIQNPKAVEGLQSLVKLLADSDAEVRAQAAKILGEAKFAKAYDGLLKVLENVNEPRGQFFAAMALGKIGDKRAARPIIEMLRANDDKDAFLRHAGVMGLLWIGDVDAILAAAKDSSPSVRIAACVALRRLHRPELAALLHDKQQKVVLEAARAINDLPVVQALPELAKLVEQPNYDEALFRRAMNANLRLGEPENAMALAKLAARGEAPAALRAEAIDMLAQWKKPAGADRITGLWRPLNERDEKPAVEAVKPIAADLLKTAPTDVKLAAIHFARRFNFTDLGATLLELVTDKQNDSKVRVAALDLLATTKDAELEKAVEIAASDADENLRKEAVALQAKLKPSGATEPLLKALENGTTGEKQNALTALGSLQGDAADKILSDWMGKLIAGTVPAELQLELIEAAAKRSAPEVKEKLEKFEAARPSDDIAPFRECLAGGNADEGKKIFFERVEASCNRCHKVHGEGGEVGPVLDGIGTRKPREYILQSIVNPNAEIAQGFESVIVTLKNGQAYAGTLKSEDKKEIAINSPEDGLVKIAKKDIDKRERGLSGMPPELAKVLSKQDLRNLIEFLATLK